jgi:peptidoglycan/xylan/chitin deacetylase (PgdA/CDA1 family)
MHPEAIILMYHELAPDAANPSGENVPYVLGTKVFRAHLEASRSAGLPISTVGAWALARTSSDGHGAGRRRTRLIFTFDDGDASNHSCALPALLEVGFKATFFVTVGRIETPGFLSWSQIVELQRAGMEIGSHTMTHRPPSLLNDSELRYEVAESKARLEDRLATPVLSISSPTGFFNRRMVDIAREAGYAAMCGGRMAPVVPGDDSFNLPRIAIKRSLLLADFNKVLRLDRLLLSWLRGEQMLRNGLKTVLGPDAYLQVRRRLLAAWPRS